ncbi:MAG: GNAT family protein [Aggregatilineales bacterium]
MTENIWQGEKVRLRGVEPEDWQYHFDWDQDTGSARYSSYVWFPQSRVATREWAEAEAKKRPTDDNVRMQIETLAGEFAGTINSHNCDRRTGTFSYGLAIYPEQRRKGYAAEAITLLMRYFFDELRYQKCTIEVYSFNTGSAKLHESLGFTLEGRLRRMIYTDGKFHDALYYGMTVEEFNERHKPS